ncbi:hypothetical protein [Dokdonella sp.]|uniref:hypothetical protein n=1 Tax=Dokdonella sp. TaxID=2291710 RepID=UPI003526DF12
MESELRNFRPTASPGARVVGALTTIALLASTTALAQVPPAARVGISINAPARPLQPEGSTQLVVRVENSGAGQPVGSRLLVPVANGLSTQTWTCVAHAGASCASPSGSGAVDQSLDGLQAGGWIEYILAADVSNSAPAFVTIEASATAAASSGCADGQTQPCRSLLSLPTGPSLSLGVDSESLALQPGGQVGYTITARSEGSHSSTSGSVLRVPVPNGLSNSRWTCSSSVGACAASSGSGPIAQLLGDFSGAEVSFRVNATVASAPPVTIVQAAAITPPYGGSCARTDTAVPTFSAAPCVARKSLATRALIFASRTADYSIDGLAVENRFVLENRGANASGSRIMLDMPSGVAGLTWSCTGFGATCPQATGSGPIDQTIASWPASGILHYDVVAHRQSTQEILSDRRISIIPPALGRCGAAELAPPCQAVDRARVENGYLRLSQGADRVGASSGDELKLTVVLGNASSESTARDLVLDIPLPVGIEAITSWTCDAAGTPAQCPIASGSGAIHQRIADLPPSSSLVYSLLARVGQSPPVTIISEARVAAPAAASLGCSGENGSAGPCIATAEISSVPVLALAQSKLAGTLAAGGAAAYSLEIFNFGADASNVRIDNTLPPGFASASWICTGLGVGCPMASGEGKVATTLARMPANSGLSYQVAGRFSNSPPDTVSNLLMAAPTSAGRCHNNASAPLTAIPCVDRTETGTLPLLQVTQTSVEHQGLIGGVANFLVTLKNLGSLASGALLDLPLPAGIQHFDWTCTGFAGAVCPRESASGSLEEAIGALPSNGSLSYAIRAQVEQGATGSINSIATVTPPAGGRCAGEECAAVAALPLAAVPAAHLDVSMSSTRAWAPPGSAPVWIIDIRNLGTEIATAFHVGNPIPAVGLSIIGWTCAGVECPAAEGAGPISQVVGSLAVYDPASDDEQVAPGRIVFTVTGQLGGSPGTEAKLAAVLTPADGDTCAPVSCQAELPLPTDLRGGAEVIIDLQADTFTAIPNSTINYTFSISVNSGLGPIDVPAFSIESPEIATSTWTCLATGGATCPSPSGSGPINELLTGMPDASTVTYSIAAQTGSNVQPSVDYQVGVNITSPLLCSPLSCTILLSIPGEDQLTLTMDADVSAVLPGSAVQYTYRVENTGGGDQFGIELFTLEPPEVVSSTWTCVATGGANCSPSGNGPVTDLISSIPIGSSITYTIDAIFASTLPASVDFQGGATFGGQGDNVAAPQGVLGCVPVSCIVTLSLPTGGATPPTISLSKTANQTSLEPGGTVRYNIVVANTGSVDGGNFQLTDAIPAGLDSFSWTCTSTGQGGCSNPGGTGAIDEYVEFLPAGGSLNFVVDAVVSNNASGTVRNLASLVPFDPIICVPVSCSVASSLPVGQPASLDVSKTAMPASGISVGAGLPISWTLRANNSGGATLGEVTLVDRIPTNVSNVSVVPGTGASCNSLNPQPGANLICTIAAGFTGERTVDISATVSADATGTVTNTVDASGSDGPVCSSCTVVNPIATGIDAGIANARPFSAGGLSGTLIDIVNMAEVTAQAATVIVTPSSSLSFLAPFASGCTASAGTGDSVVVNCPNPPSTQGVQCSANLCGIDSLPQNTAVTLFVATIPGSSVTVRLSVPGDADQSDNTIVLPIGGTP